MAAGTSSSSKGPSSGFLGDTLINISLMDGVIAANMVFEQIEEQEGTASINGSAAGGATQFTSLSIGLAQTNADFFVI